MKLAVSEWRKKNYNTCTLINLIVTRIVDSDSAFFFVRYELLLLENSENTDKSIMA